MKLISSKPSFRFLIPTIEKSKTCGEPSRTIKNPKWGWGFLPSFSHFVLCGAVVGAQQPAKVPKIGFWLGARPAFNHRARSHSGESSVHSVTLKART